MSDKNKKYNLKVAALWATRSGTMYMSMPVDDQVFDALQQVEKGGKLVFKVLAEESRSKDTSPHAYLEFMSKEDVETYNKGRLLAGKGAKGGAKTAPAAADGI
jgi:hypothetical protein